MRNGADFGFFENGRVKLRGFFSVAIEPNEGSYFFYFHDFYLFDLFSLTIAPRRNHRSLWSIVVGNSQSNVSDRWRELLSRLRFGQISVQLIQRSGPTLFHAL